MIDDDRNWPQMEPPLTGEEKRLLARIMIAVGGIGFFGSTVERDYREVLAVAMRMTRKHTRKSSE